MNNSIMSDDLRVGQTFTSYSEFEAFQFSYEQKGYKLSKVHGSQTKADPTLVDNSLTLQCNRYMELLNPEVTLLEKLRKSTKCGCMFEIKIKVTNNNNKELRIGDNSNLDHNDECISIVLKMKSANTVKPKDYKNAKDDWKRLDDLLNESSLKDMFDDLDEKLTNSDEACALAASSFDTFKIELMNTALSSTVNVQQADYETKSDEKDTVEDSNCSVKKTNLNLKKKMPITEQLEVEEVENSFNDEDFVFNTQPKTGGRPKQGKPRAIGLPPVSKVQMY
ncbi:uncharacterized protein LOC116415725 isoform X1 [Nasonia vitripennis]|uniref:Uncharacterized protein n=2 Tax=Nasonia vitripennis TaxID=7425 RepID=A0A7M7PYJ5_NASVI|nr:uncharacterized protein LOC116415725 isoform X1 [Nasonia vitripennis]